MYNAGEPDAPHALGRGGLVRVVYRLGRQAASGVLTLAAPGARPDVFALRRGSAVCAGELARGAMATRLARAVAEPTIRVRFDGSVTVYPPGAVHQIRLADWVRSHLEAQLDGPFAERLQHQLAGARLVLRAELAPQPRDDVDRRLLAALAQPLHLDQLAQLTRAPRFRLLGTIHFLRVVGAVIAEGAAGERATAAGAGCAATGRAAAARHTATDPRRAAALRLLGVDDEADVDAVKRAYRRLARALHPDLQPQVDAARRRVLERRFAEVTAAYEALV